MLRKLFRGETLSALANVDVPKGFMFRALGLSLAFALTDGAGIGMLLPILSYAEHMNSGLTSDASPLIENMTKIAELIGMPLNLAVLVIMAMSPLLARQLFYYYKTVVTARGEFRYQLKLRERTVACFLRAGLPFFIRASHGESLASVMQYAEQASVLLRAIIDLTEIAFFLLVYGLILLFISPLLAAIALPCFAFASLMARSNLKRGQQHGETIGAQSKALNTSITEALGGIRMIKMRGIEEVTINNIRIMASKLTEARIDFQRIRALLEAQAQPVLILCTFGILYFAIESLGMRLAELGVFLLIVSRINPLLIRLNTVRLTIQGGLFCNAQLQELYAAEEAMADVPSGTIPFNGVERAITLENVSFQYDDDQDLPVISGLNTSIEKGKTTAIVGPSGSGKSTLMDLIARFYDPTDGQICIDETPLRDFNLQSLRRRIAFVNQDPMMFHDTLRANIEIGLDRPLNEDELHNCLDQAHCLQFVADMLDGVDTVIGHGGFRLSGGQRQRLAIARALAQDPEILILDEPTSALDSISEAEVQAALDDLRGKLTTVIVAHRLSTVRDADKILVLESGKIVGSGIHKELLGTCPSYKKLVEIQNLLRNHAPVLPTY